MQTPTAVNSNQTARSAPYAVFDFALSTCRWEASACEVTPRIPTKSAQNAPTNLALSPGGASEGTGEPLAMLLRSRNAGSKTAADHLVVIQEVLGQLPFSTSAHLGPNVLMRIDGAGCSHQVVNHLHAQGMSYSVGFTVPSHTPQLLADS
jgi:hypothetical protein